MTRRELDLFISGCKTLRDGASDAVASNAVFMYPTFTGTGNVVKAGTRIRWGDKLLVVSYDTYDREEYNPDHNPTGFTEVQYNGGYRIIPAVITADIVFGLGEKAWWEGRLYESLIANNSWTPSSYPAGWKLA